MAGVPEFKPVSSLIFLPLLPGDLPLFGPRLGEVSIARSDGSTPLAVKTPGLIAATSRGVVPHLSRDHVRITKAIRWVHVPFESFLERTPPVPTLQSGSHPLHTFLGFPSSTHIVSMSARDPFDGREMPPNGKDHVSVYCIRGVRKITSSSWNSYAAACNPDLVVALSDTPFTPSPHSQKRLTKSIERSAGWLTDLLQTRAHFLSASTSDSGSSQCSLRYSGNILVHMAGGAGVHARKAFADSLLEPLEGRDRDRLRPFSKLDEGVAGYTIDLIPLHAALRAISKEASEAVSDPTHRVMNSITPISRRFVEDPSELSALLQASLSPLPRNKPRLVNSSESPHEMLRLIMDVGIDLFDAHWAQRAADIGIALDFRFPEAQESDSRITEAVCPGPQKRRNGKRDLGHNLYSSKYAHDHSRLASSLLDAASWQQQAPTDAIIDPTIVTHSLVDEPPSNDDGLQPPFTRAYLHHLLHTHEMSAHALLVMHNLSVLDAFFSGIRAVLSRSSGKDDFSECVGRFLDIYDEDMVVFDEARLDWTGVELARGKGRLAREKLKQAESSLGTAVEL
ncbi:hypothetical protein AcW2_004283 [Taiwanofungus camphoratus]|nr:hypothetical protein AcW2_004283 [Antrodia cinnamomea]